MGTAFVIVWWYTVFCSAQVVSRILDKVIVEYTDTKEKAQRIAKTMMEFYFVRHTYITGPNGFSKKIRKS
jgi:hypothetical protein